MDSDASPSNSRPAQDPAELPDPLLATLPAADSAAVQRALGLLVGGAMETLAGQTHSSAAGDKLVLLGAFPQRLGGSRYAALVVGQGRAAASGASSDAKLEKTISVLRQAGVISEAITLDRDGWLPTLAALLLSGQPGLGARLDVTGFGAARFDALLFGQSAHCALLVLPAQRIGTVLSEAHTSGVAAAVVGELLAAPELFLTGRGISARWTLSALREAAASAPGGRSPA